MSVVQATFTKVSKQALDNQRTLLQNQLDNNRYLFGTSKASCVIPHDVDTVVDLKVGRGNHSGVGKRYDSVHAAGLSKQTLRSIEKTAETFRLATGETVTLGAVIVLYAPFRYVVDVQVGNQTVAMLYTSHFAAGTGFRYMVRKDKNNLKLGTPSAQAIKEWLA